MKTYDWIVIGGGITGSALSYELKKSGFSVLLIEQNHSPQNATRFGYGGIPYWSGRTPLTCQLCDEGIALQRQFPQELDSHTEYREIDLLLTVDPQDSIDEVASFYSQVAIPPEYLDSQTAYSLEPLLYPEAIKGVFKFNHAHVDGMLLAKAYQQTFMRLGGEILFEKVERINPQSVVTNQLTHNGNNIAVCAGGFSRSLLKASDISVPLYFTHAEMIEILPSDLELRSIIMPANTKRLGVETEVSNRSFGWAWEQAVDKELTLPSIDVGAVQFSDRRMKIGQLSRVLTNPFAEVNAKQSEAEIRAKVGKILPALSTLPGSWQHCLVAFSHDYLPLIGNFSDNSHIHLFTGFTSPMVYVPSLARRFAAFAAGNSEDWILPHLSPQRFA